MNEKIERVKSHFKENWKAYAIGTVIATTAVITTVVVMNSRTNKRLSELTVDSRVLVKNNWKPIVNNITEVHLERRGHPGNIIRCIETGEIFASQNRAAKMLGLNPARLSEYLAGKTDNVKGLTFEIVGEALA